MLIYSRLTPYDWLNITVEVDSALIDTCIQVQEAPALIDMLNELLADLESLVEAHGGK